MDLSCIASHAFLTIFGGIGNVLLLVTLRRDKKLRARLSSLISAVMGAQAIADATFCLVGVPLHVINLTIGEEAATSLGLCVCYAAYLGTWRLIKVSFGMLWSLAATRFAAVYMPMLYRRYASSTAVTIAAVAIPIGVSQAVFLYGIITNWIRVKPIPGAGFCLPYMVNDIHPSVSFPQLEVLFTFIPVPFSLLLYLLVWTRLLWQRMRNTKVTYRAGGDTSGPVPAGDANTTVSSVAKHLRKLQQDRIRIMTLVFAVNLVLILPNQVMFFGGFKPSMGKSVPMAVAIIDWLLFLAIAINPVVYAVVFGEMRQGFQRTLTLTRN